MKNFKLFITFFLIYVIVQMVINPAVYMQVTLNGFSAWALNVLPSVLPFIFFTKLLSNLGHVEKFSKIFAKPVSKFFGCKSSASYVFLMSIISGYPVGAKMTADLYEEGKISRTDAYRMTSFCSNSGPMFIIGAVGAGMLKNAMFGYIIFIAHVIGAVLNGLVYRKLNTKEQEQTSAKTDLYTLDFNLGQVVTDSAMSIISVGTIIAIFFVIIHSLSPLFNLFPPSIVGTLEGLIEITKGCNDIALTLPIKLASLACTFVISFGGLSTILQSIVMLNRLKMPVSLFVLQKTTHAILSTIVASCILLII